jgi:hypothetical protein
MRHARDWCGLQRIDKHSNVRRTIMNNASRNQGRLAGSDLHEMVEPLANYICAADEPKRALMTAVRTLVHEVESTHRAAIVHTRMFSEN